MRRLTLLLFGFIGLSFCQVQAPQPITVNIVMPTPKPWLRLVELVIPGLIGFGAAFGGVWFTSKRNAAENAANRTHQLDVEREKARIAADAKSRDNRWEFRKDMYTKLMSTIQAIVTVTKRIAFHLVNSEPVPAELVNDLYLCFERFYAAANLAPLAANESVLAAIQRRRSTLLLKNPKLYTMDDLRAIQKEFNALTSELQDAGRKDLWGEAEPTSTAEPNRVSLS